VSEKASGTVRALHGAVERIALLGLVSSFIVQEFLVQFFFSVSELALLSIWAITGVFVLSAKLSLIFSFVNCGLLLGLKSRVEDVVFVRVNGDLGFPNIWGFNVGAILAAEAFVGGGGSST